MRRFFKRKTPKTDVLEKPENKKVLTKADRAFVVLDDLTRKDVKDLVGDAIKCLPYPPDFKNVKKRNSA